MKALLIISKLFVIINPRSIQRLLKAMEKDNLTRQFAHRLREAMIQAGFHSPRSTSGVSIHKLAEITGYSLQICRKYLRGEAIPEPVKLAEIANYLNISPGWLLFGDHQDDAKASEHQINISKPLLHYILINAAPLYNRSSLEADLPDFLMTVISDISQINANEEQSKKIIDLALSSAKHF